MQTSMNSSHKEKKNPCKNGYISVPTGKKIQGGKGVEK